MFEHNILVTGGAGFIGTNFIEYYTKVHPETRIVDLDALTYAANLKSWAMQKMMPNVVPVKGDICNRELVDWLFEAFDIDGVIHFAAESHVDNSIKDPLRFVRTNVDGTAVLLEAAKTYWQATNRFETSRFHHISTDEVYGSLGEEGYFTETTPYAPNSPYSSSKASSDLLVRAYVHTYGMNATISNCSNNYGPWQNAEKLIPTVIRKCLAHEPIPVYGTGLNIRDWLWVEDHCRAVDLIYHKGKAGETYNVGGHNEKTNLEIVGKICEVLDKLVPWTDHKYGELTSFVTDRLGHDFRYAIDPTKIICQLAWKPSTTFDEGLRKTVQWYLNSLL